MCTHAKTHFHLLFYHFNKTTYGFMYSPIEEVVLTQNEQNNERHVYMMRIAVWSMVQSLQYWYYLQYNASMHNFLLNVYSH
jgi:hypothetical protein